MQEELIVNAALDLLTSVYEGPQGKGSWITDADPNAGMFGTLESVSAAMASRVAIPGSAMLAAHVEHLRYQLSLVNRSFAGENAFATANWGEAWTKTSVTDDEWRGRVAGLRREYEKVRKSIRTNQAWLSDRTFLTGIIAVVAHAAYHLGAMKQIIGLLQDRASASGSL